ncbi:MAG TPA: hypothetical protein VNI61_00180 [Gemmatimonadales bacterium]|nr:hypothetical protein [Gemmatimonadales bacterium]
MSTERSAERGEPNSGVARSFRIPHSAFRIGVALVATGCNPYTTRPPFVPLPDAPVAYVDAPRERVVPALRTWLEARGFRIDHAEPLDGYLVTAWYDPENKRSFSTERDVPNLARTFRLRCWLDPDVPGATRIVVEAVYRPVYDPSRTPRDLEVLVPEGHEGRAVAERLMAEMKERFGVPPGRS